MTVPSLMSKAFSYQDLHRKGRGGRAVCVPPRGMVRQKYPGADRVNNFKITIIDYTYTLFYKQHFYKQRQAEIGKKSSKC